MSWSISVALVAVFTAIASARSAPPPPTNAALMARYIVDEADYTSIATKSVRDDTKGYPYVSLVSLSDGLKGQGTGALYVFVTPLDAVGQDLEQDTRVTMMMSLVQGSFCDEKGYDAMDPRCARVTFSGKVKKILEDDPEYPTAKDAMFGRHPWLVHVPPSHHFYIAKLEIETAAVLAGFGGPAYVSPDEYYNVDKKTFEEYARKYR